MSKYSLLTDYIPKLQQEKKFGEWIIDTENNGTPEHPIHFPWINYCDMVCDFMDDVHRFADQHEDMNLHDYRTILEECGITLDRAKTADVETLDVQGVCALIVANVRAERFCDGAIMSSCKDGTFLKWLNKLKEFDN